MRFVAVVNSAEEATQAKFMVESLRSFGGEYSDSPVWIFYPSHYVPETLSALRYVEIVPLDIEAQARHYPLADKVCACAKAEEMMEAEPGSLAWVNLDCLFVNPPVLFEVGASFEAALRPVHLRNVGSSAGQPLDEYWKTVYDTIGLKDAEYAVESFVDGQTLRPYFNTHCFSIHSARGILQAWRECFLRLIFDRGFQDGPCQDELHQVFLHQVVFSALVTRSVKRDRIRMLPPEYGYPLHLQERIPASRRFQFLNSTVCAVYEEAKSFTGIEISEPLTSWLKAQR